MREHKFRARWRDSGKIIIDFMEQYTIAALNYNCFIVEEFTGLLDKNGKDVFQGDIIKVSGHTYEDNFTAEVTEKRGGFWLDKDYLGNWKEYMLEVIGNVWEHSHLLNGESNEAK